MIDRKDLKERAMRILKKNYWKVFLATLILIFSGGVTLQGTYNFTFSENEPFIQGMLPDIKMYTMLSDFLIKFLPTFLLLFTIGALFRVFVGYALEVGGKRVFLDGSKTEEINFKTFTFAFNEHYKKVVKTLFIRDVRIVGWGLLLFFPGLYKWYQYRFVPYILSDNPNLTEKRALEISKIMTRKLKFEMFKLDISFFVWILLGNLFWGVGMIFVIPYIETTMAELYLYIKDKSFEDETLDPSDLNVEISRFVNSYN
jgi:uncharacterized membrane protein